MVAKKILVVDVASRRLERVAVTLREAGFEVTTTCDPTTVAKFAVETGAELLITNYVLENSSGVELCQSLRHDKRTAALPAVLVTAPGYTLGAAIPAKVGIRKIVRESSPTAEIVDSVNEVLARRAA